MTNFALSWAHADDDIPTTPTPKRRACPRHVWGQHWRTGYEPGTVGNLFERRCRCGAVQIWRGSQWGELLELVKEH